MRFLPLLLVLALVGSACGVTRESEFAAAVEAPIDTGSESGDTELGDTESGDPTGQIELIPETSVPEYVPPTPLADASEIALTASFADGEFEITHGEWFELVASTAGNKDFVDRILGGFVPDGFGAGLLAEMLAARAITYELAEFDVVASADDQDAARSLLVENLSRQSFATEDDPVAAAEAWIDSVAYWQFTNANVANQRAIGQAWIDNAEPSDGEPCVSHFLVETEAEALEALARVEDGETFADVASEVSIDSGSAAQGGSLGCSDPANYVPEFAAAIESAELDQLVGPVETQFGFHVLVVTDYEVNGVTLAIASLTERLVEAEVTVDPRIGEWSPAQLSVVPAA